MTVTFKGEPVSISGQIPKPGQIAPEFSLCASDLSEITLSSLRGIKVVLNIMVSVDTPVCAMSIQKFNRKVASKKDTVVLCVSADLPFATSRFCSDEEVEDVLTASSFRSPEFSEQYGVNINSGPLRGLTSRAIVVINEDGMVLHSELVSEITDEPNYEAVLASLRTSV